MHQKPRKLGQSELPSGEAQRLSLCDEAQVAKPFPEDSGFESLLEQVLERENMRTAWQRVRSNRGAAGVDGRSIEQTEEYLKMEWPTIRQAIREGSYQPLPVRRVQIPKSGGGIRELGIPTVVDRLIQQALLQVLQPILDPDFSEYSYGFRPGRSAHDAVKQALTYVDAGFNVVVDIDLERFFDTVNHDILMNRLSRKIADRPVLALIRKFLQCGIMSGIELSDRIEGTPQGGPLSPLLANVLLDEVDKELERRGHRFVRYADDCNIYVRSQRAGERVLESMTRLYSRLRLKVNAQKTAVGPTYGRKFLGFCFRRWAKGSSKISIAPKAIQAFRDRIRQITSRSKGRSLPSIVEALKQYVPGWKAYFRLAKVSQIYKDLDSWIRHRLRALIFKQWKRGPTIYSRVRAMGYGHDIARKAASHGSSWWRGSTGYFNIVLPDRYFDAIGVPRVA
jgi:RNA-directed DNA polymerase